MKSKLFVLCVLAIFAVNLSSTIWEVNQDGSGDFTTVQAGIDASANTDTVLVYPGIYYENLEILEKAITLGSLYLTTGDEFYILYTILDGNQESSVIRLEDTPVYYHVYIIGFTIQNGIGYEYNTSGRRSGGGIFAWESYLNLKNCFIQNNVVNHGGGGLCLLFSNLSIAGNTIRYNEANDSGGGIAIAQDSFVDYDSENLNNIYLNYASLGNDIYHLLPNYYIQEIVIDTFTVINPDNDFHHIFLRTENNPYPQQELMSLDIQNGFVEQVNQDVYVSTDGNDNNSGLTPSDPLKTIAYAMIRINADSLDQRSVHIADGTYSFSQNGQILPIQVKSYINIVGESKEYTILDAENQEGFFVGKRCKNSYNIENFTLLHNNDQVNIRTYLSANVYLKNIYLDDGFYQSIFSQCSDVTLENVTQVNTTGGGIYYDSGLFTGVLNIINCKIDNNYGNIPILCLQGSFPSSDSLIVNLYNTEVSDNLEIGSAWSPRTCAIKVDWGTKLNLINSTIGNNESLHTGAAVQLAMESEVNITNSIIYGNIPYNLCLNGNEGPITLNADNSLIGGGIDGILNMGTNLINWDDLTMLDEDPLWLGAGYEFPYSLSVNSPCIDTGTLELPYGVELPAYDLAGNPRVMGSNIDMGAYEYPGNAAPIYLEVNNENLNWQIPPGFAPESYNVYLDDEFQANVSAFQMEYILHNLIIGQSYKVGVSAVYAGEETAIIPKYFIYNPVGIEETTHISPLTSHLSNYPNPFNPTTTISFNVTQSSVFATLEIFNIKGQKVKTLVNARLSSGNYNISWNGRDSNNKRVSTGEYLAKLKVNGTEEEVLKIMLLK